MEAEDSDKADVPHHGDSSPTVRLRLHSGTNPPPALLVPEFSSPLDPTTSAEESPPARPRILRHSTSMARDGMASSFKGQMLQNRLLRPKPSFKQLAMVAGMQSSRLRATSSDVGSDDATGSRQGSTWLASPYDAASQSALLQTGGSSGQHSGQQSSGSPQGHHAASSSWALDHASQTQQGFDPIHEDAPAYTATPSDASLHPPASPRLPSTPRHVGSPRFLRSPLSAAMQPHVIVLGQQFPPQEVYEQEQQAQQQEHQQQQQEPQHVLQQQPAQQQHQQPHSRLAADLGPFVPHQCRSLQTMSTPVALPPGQPFVDSTDQFGRSAGNAAASKEGADRNGSLAPSHDGSLRNGTLYGDTAIPNSKPCPLPTIYSARYTSGVANRGSGTGEVEFATLRSRSTSQHNGRDLELERAEVVEDRPSKQRRNSNLLPFGSLHRALTQPSWHPDHDAMDTKDFEDKQQPDQHTKQPSGDGSNERHTSLYQLEAAIRKSLNRFNGVQASDRLRGLTSATPLSFYCCHRRVDIGAFLKALFWDVWSPAGPYRLTWDFIMLVGLQYVIYITPYIVAFNLPTADLKTPIAEVDLFINCLFLTDVLINFRTGYINHDGQLEFDRLRIAKHYVTTWFVVDVLTSLPWDNIFNDNFSVLKALRLLRVARFIRVLRVLRQLKVAKAARLKGVLTRLDELAGHHVMRILLFVWVAFSLVHWSACTFYYVAQLYGPDEDTWITRQLDSNASNAMRYVFALYWAVTTMSTVGYGDITAVTVGEKVVSMVAMLIGASVFAYFMGAMATILAALNTADVRVTRKKALVREFVHHRKLPRRLSDKISNYYLHVLQRQVHQDESDLIQELPASLRMQVTWHLHKEVLEQVPFFQGKPAYFIVALAPCLKLEYYSPGDVIVRQGNLGHEMYFVLTGEVELRLYEEDAGQTSASSQVPQEGMMAGASGHLGGANSRSMQDIHATSVAGGTGGSERKSQRRLFRRTVVDKVLRRKRYLKVQLLDEDLDNLPYRKIGTLGPGEYFGEYTCFFNEPRVATVVANDFCELYSLSRIDLEQIVSDFPEFADDLGFLLRDPNAAGGSGLETTALCMREQMGMPSLATQSRADVLHMMHKVPSVGAALGSESRAQTDAPGVAYVASTSRPERSLYSKSVALPSGHVSPGHTSYGYVGRAMPK